MIDFDGGHDDETVVADLKARWPLLTPGGVLVGDDYHTNRPFPGVRQAFNEFFDRPGLFPFENANFKCRISEPLD